MWTTGIDWLNPLDIIKHDIHTLLLRDVAQLDVNWTISDVRMRMNKLLQIESDRSLLPTDGLHLLDDTEVRSILEHTELCGKELEIKMNTLIHNTWLNRPRADLWELLDRLSDATERLCDNLDDIVQRLEDAETDEERDEIVNNSFWLEGQWADGNESTGVRDNYDPYKKHETTDTLVDDYLNWVLDQRRSTQHLLIKSIKQEIGKRIKKAKGI